MTETWVKLNNNANRKDTVIEISNTGKMKTKNGDIKVIPLRRAVYYNGKLKLIYRILAEIFIPNPDNKPCVDHITHSPVDININDIRNLRWCTYKENNNFSEGIENKRKAKIGTHLSEKAKQKISKHNKNNPKCAFWTGKTMSEETKNKMSESAKKGWEKRRKKMKRPEDLPLNLL